MDLYSKAAEFTNQHLPFAIATVVRVEGSSSARRGSKALIDSQGRIVMGWVGGGCAESAVRSEAIRCMRTETPELITLDMQDEVLGVGMPCGGMMDVYIEPVLPQPELVIAGHGRIAETLARLGHRPGDLPRWRSQPIRHPALSPVSVLPGAAGRENQMRSATPTNWCGPFSTSGRNRGYPCFGCTRTTTISLGRRSRRNFSKLLPRRAGKPPSSAQRRTAKMVTDCFRWEEFRSGRRWWMVSWRAKILPFAPRYCLFPPLPTLVRLASFRRPRAKSFALS